MENTNLAMDDLSSRQIRQLKKQAHGIRPRVQIGKNGINENIISNIDKILHDHELIKIKYLDHKIQRKSLTAIISEKTDSIILDEIGNTVILFRRSSDHIKRKIDPGKP